MFEDAYFSVVPNASQKARRIRKEIFGWDE